jgi:anti-sigma B factor antagonist
MTIGDRRPFAIETATLPDGGAVIALAGECDLYSQPKLTDALRAALDAGERRLVVDLSAATFIDSSVLGALTEAWKRLHATGGADIVVVVTDRRLRKIFEITGLDAVFRLVESVEEAVPPGPDVLSRQTPSSSLP